MNYLYAPEFVKERQAVFFEVEAAIGPGSRVEMFSSIAGFSDRLTRFNNPEIIVLLSVGHKNMPGVVALKRFIHNAAIILLLSDDDPETMASAISLRAKFIGKMDEDLDKIVPIIQKMMVTKLNKQSLKTDLAIPA